MNKKSQVVTMYDIAAWFILFVGVTIWILILRFESVDYSLHMRNDIQALDKDEVFISMLRTKIGEDHVSDLLLSSYTREKPEEFRDKLDNYLKSAYGAEVCWRLIINKKPFINPVCRTDSKRNLLDSTIYMPYEEGAPYSINLVIAGYKK
jgi:hypothetical protein